MTKFLATLKSEELRQFKHLQEGEQNPSSEKQEQCKRKQFDFLQLQEVVIGFGFLFGDIFVDVIEKIESDRETVSKSVFGG